MMYWFMSSCHNKNISNNVIFAYYVSSHDYESVMSVLCTPLQVKCYRLGLIMQQNRTDLSLCGKTLMRKKCHPEQHIHHGHCWTPPQTPPGNPNIPINLNQTNEAPNMKE